jgi:amino-acid N-acetyltransferase
LTRIRSQGRNYFQRPPAAALKALLLEAQLPLSDLTEAHLEHFIGCASGQALAGVVGVELYPPHALLRSLVVTPSERGRGIGRGLVTEAERHARAHGAHEIYLLTTTAERFFRHAGYEPVPRSAAPAAIRETAEFTAICPASAALMRKALR